MHTLPPPKPWAARRRGPPATTVGPPAMPAIPACSAPTASPSRPAASLALRSQSEQSAFGCAALHTAARAADGFAVRCFHTAAPLPSTGLPMPPQTTNQPATGSLSTARTSVYRTGQTPPPPTCRPGMRPWLAARAPATGARSSPLSCPPSGGVWVCRRCAGEATCGASVAGRCALSRRPARLLSPLSLPVPTPHPRSKMDRQSRRDGAKAEAHPHSVSSPLQASKAA